MASRALLILLACFIGLPVLELYLLIQVGSEVGAFAAILLTLSTAVVGLWLVRRQGVSVIFRLRETLDRGEPPALEMLEGALLLLAGLALFLPGFATDAFGFILLVPWVRQRIIRWVLSRVRVDEAVVVVREPGAARGSRIIEGTWKRGED